VVFSVPNDIGEKCRGGQAKFRGNKWVRGVCPLHVPDVKGLVRPFVLQKNGGITFFEICQSGRFDAQDTLFFKQGCVMPQFSIESGGRGCFEMRRCCQIGLKVVHQLCKWHCYVTWCARGFTLSTAPFWG
jgi:hypothetical protein